MERDKTERWFAVQTKVGQEALAAKNLGRQNFESWYPTLPKAIRSGRQTNIKLKPLFPGYVFLRSPTGLSLRPVDSSCGVVRLVRTGSSPAVLPAGLVPEFMKLADDNGVVAFRDNLHRGDKVRVMVGAFDNWIGRVVDLPERDRVTLLLDMIGRSVPVTLATSAVVKAA
ncbi:MAG: transcriptional activator RfaH [Hyphomonadaceae bacterium]|nr:transcriptional activator RfaH [Hyphomonadaceae bacterium]OUX94284.1 MAG: hypothetical protein CBB77_04035 [Hyphomonas sp. TMED17]CAI8323541.1 MAG: Transcription termination/antitermination protein NusG [Hyphomonas sp. TMED17]